MSKRTIQRGDVVDVSLNNGSYTFRGIVVSATKRYGIRVFTRSSGTRHRVGDGTNIRIIRRLGLKTRCECVQLAERYR